ncbi:Mbov_0397 family ICE element conjugal transfer ATPase [Mycoplasma zalophidermidis]|uniref:Mbov_0397 family ICE element conjugal transfer ATPase n=1 Tax=Mycoplasma zalophidermidis TaxID=398174 RepID=UPI00215C6728|nr:conjugal transfer protein TraE [Mycoplasma zalophidermidis]MCR8966566.1 conjugal transfer protein TraE [Mycoplasma zalophidermidis]
MRMLQPKNIKKTKLKVFKNFDWIDFVVLLACVISSIFLTQSVLPKKMNPYFKILIWFLTFGVFSVLLIKIRKYDVRLYRLLIRMICYIFKTKKYNKRNSTKNLIPYAEMLEDRYIKTKMLRGGVKYFSVLKFKGKTPWSEEESDRESFLAKFIDVLDNTKIQISFVRQKELIDYSKNFEALKTNLDQKMQYLKLNNASAEVIENYTNLYEEKFLDFETLDKEIMLDTYYVVLYERRLSELQKNIDMVYQYMNSMELEPRLLKSADLVRFLARLNDKELDEELLKKYIDQQQLKTNGLRRNYRDEEEILSNDWILRFKKWLLSKSKKHKNDNSSSKTKLISLDELLRADNVVFKANYFIKDGLYYSIQTVNELPLRLQDGWNSELLNNDSVIVWNLGAISTEAQAHLLDSVAKKNIDNSAVINSKFQRKSNNLQLEAMEYLQDQLLIDGNNLFDSHFMIINKASSLKELKMIESKNYHAAVKARIYLTSLPFRQFEAYAQSCLITTNNLKEAVQISSFNAAYGWSFENEFHNDGNISILGTTISTGEPIIVDRFYKKDAKRTNYNWMTVGTSGTGKSSSKSKSIVDELAQNRNVYVIDLENEYKYLAKKFGGTIFNIGNSGKTTLNPLEIRVSIWDNEDDNKQEVSVEGIVLKHLEWLEGFFKLVNVNFRDEHIMVILSCLKRLYEQTGVYDIRSAEEFKMIKKWPIMSDLIVELENYKYVDEFEKQRKREMVANIADSFKFLFENNGKYQNLYNAETKIDLDNEFIIFNTKELMSLGKDDSNLGSYVLLSLIQDLVYQNVVKNPNKHTVLFIDEIHQYVDNSRPIMLNFVWKLTKTGRKYLFGLDLTTQSPSDLLVSAKAESIVQNCQYSTIFGLKEKDLKAVEQMYEYTGGLNKSMTSFLSAGVIGNNMISLNLNSKIKIDVWYNEYEKGLYFKQGDFRKQEL